MVRWLLVVMLCMPVLVATPGARQGGALPREPITLVNAVLVDVVTGDVQEGVAITLRDGLIEAISPGGTAAPGSRAIDVGGRFVIPGLIDAHVHIGDTQGLREALESGVTTVRSAGAQMWVDVGLRELVKQGLVAGPDVLATGYHVRGGLGEDAFLVDPSLPADLLRAEPTPDVLRRVVEKRTWRTAWTGSRPRGPSEPGCPRPIRASRCSPRRSCR